MIVLSTEVTIVGHIVKVSAAENDNEKEDGMIQDLEIDGECKNWDEMTVGSSTLEKEIVIELLEDAL